MQNRRIVLRIRILSEHFVWVLSSACWKVTAIVFSRTMPPPHIESCRTIYLFQTRNFNVEARNEATYPISSKLCFLKVQLAKYLDIWVPNVKVVQNEIPYISLLSIFYDKRISFKSFITGISANFPHSFRPVFPKNKGEGEVSLNTGDSKNLSLLCNNLQSFLMLSKTNISYVCSARVTSRKWFEFFWQIQEFLIVAKLTALIFGNLKTDWTFLNCGASFNPFQCPLSTCPGAALEKKLKSIILWKKILFSFFFLVAKTRK